MSRGVGWSRWAAAATTALLVVVFGWRASVSWSAVADGVAGKLTAALLITTMGVGSLGMLILLVRDARGRARVPAGSGSKS